MTTDDPVAHEFWSHPPPPDGTIPEGPGPTQYSYLDTTEDGDTVRRHGVVNNVRIYDSEVLT
jgi:hypothetical protein